MMDNNKLRIFAVSADKQTRIRIPQEIFEHLKFCAFENGRSFNTEILYRLVKTLKIDDANTLISQGENNGNI